MSSYLVVGRYKGTVVALPRRYYELSPHDCEWHWSYISGPKPGSLALPKSAVKLFDNQFCETEEDARKIFGDG